MISYSSFHMLLGVMSVLALVVFVALYFVKAGYGMFRTASWGWSIDNRLAWVLMEAPVFVVMWWLWAESGVGMAQPQFLFFLLFLPVDIQNRFNRPFGNQQFFFLFSDLTVLSVVLLFLDCQLMKLLIQ